MPSELNLTEYVSPGEPPGFIAGLFIGDPVPGPTLLQALFVQLVTVWGIVESLVQTTVCPRRIVRFAGSNSNSQLPAHETMETPTWAGRVVVVGGAGLVVGVVVVGGLVVGDDVALVVGGAVATVACGCVSEVAGEVGAVVALGALGRFEVEFERLCVPVLCSAAVAGPL